LQQNEGRSCRAELDSICRSISEVARPLNSEVASEKAELNSLFLASDAVRASQRHLAAVTDKLLAAVVQDMVKAWRHEAPETLLCVCDIGGRPA